MLMLYIFIISTNFLHYMFMCLFIRKQVLLYILGMEDKDTSFWVGQKANNFTNF